MKQKEEDYMTVQNANKSVKKSEQKLSFSAYTLEIVDKKQSASFNKYQRQEV